MCPKFESSDIQVTVDNIQNHCEQLFVVKRLLIILKNLGIVYLKRVIFEFLKCNFSML